jgi:hypothetical protein
MATVNRHPQAHNEGWRVSGQETDFCWVSVPYLTNVVGLVVFLNLLTNSLSEPTPTNAPVVDKVVLTIWDEPKSFNLNQTLR